MPTPFIVAQISDFHLFADPAATLLEWPTEPSFRAVLEEAVACEPDLLLITGDLTQDGSPAAYRRIMSALEETGIRYCCLPGNHDDPEIMRDLMSTPAGPEIHIERLSNWHLLMLDSHVEGATHGRVHPDAIDQLNDVLDTLSQPVMIAVHHPPVKIGCKWIDGINLQRAAPLLDAVRSHPQVKLVLSGHVHQSFATSLGHAAIYTTPATSIQFKPGVDEFTLDDAAPGFRLVRLYSDGSHDSQVRRVPVSFAIDPTATGYE